MPAPPEPDPRPLMLREAGIALGLMALSGIGLCLLWSVHLDRSGASAWDEGVYLASARSLLRGEKLFSSVFSSQPPLFLEIITASFRLFGDNLAVGRGAAVAFALASLAATGWIAWRAVGPLAAAFAFVLLASSPNFEAGVCQAEIFSLGFGALAVAATLQSHATRLSWLAAAGVLFALGLLCKLWIAPLIVPIALIVGAPPRPDNLEGDDVATGRPSVARVLAAAGAFGLGALLTLGAGIASYDGAAAYDQVVRYHLVAKEVFPADSLARQLSRFSKFLSADPGLSILALAGFAGLARRSKRTALWIAGWILASTAFLLTHSPLMVRHQMLLLLPLSVAAAAIVRLRPLERWTEPRRLVLALLLLFLVAVRPVAHWGDWRIAGVFRDGLSGLPEEDSPEVGIALREIRKLTRPADLVASDEPMLPFRAGRGVPPDLCDSSGVRIGTGYLTAERAIAASQGARMIILWSGRFERLPDYVQWVETYYRPVRRWPAVRPVRAIYLRRF